jgi:MFS transporter, FSR family, fosmidomycin resistance protein
LKQPLPESRMEEAQVGRIALLSSGHFLNDAYHGFMAPLLPLLMTKIGFNITHAALLISIQSIFTSFSQPVFGYIADRIKWPIMTVWGPLLTAVFLGSIGLAKSYTAVVIILIMAGIGTSSFHPQSAMFAGRAGGNRSGLAMSLFVTSGSAGHALGPMIIIPIATYLGLEYSPITILPGIIISWLLFRNLPILPHAPAKRIIIDEKIEEKGQMKILVLLYTIVTIRALLVCGFITFLPIYMIQKSYSLLFSGSAITIFELAGSAGSIFGGHISDRIGRKIVVILSLTLPLPLLWLFLHLTGIGAFIFLAISGFFLFSSVPVIIIMAQELYPRKVNMVSSVMMGMAWGIGGLLVSPMGALADRIGVGQVMQLLLFCALPAGLASLFLKEMKK